MIAVRAGAASDVPACVDLWSAALAHRDGAASSPQVVERAAEKFDRRIVRFAVVGDARLDGFALTIGGGAADTAKLALLAVSPRAAGRGAGRALLADAVDAARAASTTSIRLKVRTGNVAAIALYRSAGFVPDGEPTPHPLGGDPMITYRLDLERADGTVR